MMAKIKERFQRLNPWLKGTIWFCSGIIILFIILIIIVSFWGDHYVAQRLKKSVSQSSDSTYTLNFDNLDLNVITGSVTVHHMHIHADTAAFGRSSSPSTKPPSELYKGTIGKLRVGGLHIISAFLGNKLHIGKITIKKPHITILNNPHPVPNDTSQHFSSVDSSIYAVISNRYKALKLGAFNISKAHVVSLQAGDTLFSLGSVNLTLKNIMVDSASARSGRNFPTDDIQLEAHRLLYNLSDSLNKAVLGRFLISSDKQSIELDSLQLIPLYPKFKYSEQKGVQTDRIHLVIPKIKCRHVDFKTFAKSGHIHGGYMEVDKGRLEDFHSKLLPPPPPKLKALPNKVLINARQKLKVDTLKLNKAFISYSEYHRLAPKAGKVTFEDLNAVFYHLTNYQQAIEQGKAIKMHVRTNVMGKGLLDVHATFPLDTHDSFHKVKGTLSSMPLTAFNPILKYIAFVEIESGKLHHLTFNMALNNDSSSGEAIMNYEGLKVAVLDKKTMKPKGLTNKIESFVANTFVIKGKNTSKDGLRKGKIKFQRIKHKGIFNYWWKSLFSGLKNSIK
jgi:hypothetical protein